MKKQFFALFAPANGEGDAGGGASGGGEDEGGGKPKDEVVPKTQFIAAINSANEKHKREMQALRDEMDMKLAAIAAKPAPTESAKRYTRVELNAMVEARQITQEQADAQMDFQTREDAKSDAKRVATETVTAAQQKERVETEIARYKAVAPEILDDAHETRERIKVEFKALVGLGDDSRALATQLKAIRAVLGPVEKLERALNGKPAHESHREFGGGDGGSQGKKKSPDGALTYDDLSPREKAHYDKGIQTGLYKDKAAVNAELKFAKSHIRHKYGAMA